MCLIRTRTYTYHKILLFIIILLVSYPLFTASSEGQEEPPMEALGTFEGPMEKPEGYVNKLGRTSKLPINRDKGWTMDDMVGRHGGQCVVFVQDYFKIWGNPYFKGRAIDIPLNTNYPEVGWVVLTTEGPHGHVAIVTDIQDETLILTESNYNNDEIVTVGRKLLAESELIRGFFAINQPQI